MLFMPNLKSLLAIAVETLDTKGILLEANAGFLKLIKKSEGEAIGTRIGQFFIQPNFSKLSEAQTGNEGIIYQGLLTIGEYAGHTQTLHACLWKTDTQLRLLAEYDIEELERLNDTVLDLNRGYADTQLELAQTNLKLQQRELRLEELVSQLTDINTELKKAQNYLIQSEKLASIGLLAAGVAHEINNPISFVNSNLGTLKSYVDNLLVIINAYDTASVNCSSNDFVKVNELKIKMDLSNLKVDIMPLLDESQDGLDRVKIIIQGLKNFSRIGATENWSSVDIHRGLESTLSVVWNEFKFKCEVRKEYANLPLIQCELSQINQVFMNLFVNAAHAIEDRGIVTIRTGQKNDEIWIEIIDTGKGIPEENLAHIFDPFFTTKPVGKGTGLGLSISYGIVKKHHGRIEVQSEIGQGTTFRVWLPINQPKKSKINLELR